MDWLYIVDIWTVIETRLETEENDVKSWRRNSWHCSQDLTSRWLSSSPTPSCLCFVIARLESVVICHLSAYIFFLLQPYLKKDNILSACCHFSDLNLLHVMWNLSRSSHSYFESIYSYSLTRCMSQQPSCSHYKTNFCYLYDLLFYSSSESLHIRFTDYTYYRSAKPSGSHHKSSCHSLYDLITVSYQDSLHFRFTNYRSGTKPFPPQDSLLLSVLPYILWNLYSSLTSSDSLTSGQGPSSFHLKTICYSLNHLILYSSYETLYFRFTN